MLLALPAPAKRSFNFNTPHDFAGHRTSSTVQQLSSPPPEGAIIYQQAQKSPAEESAKSRIVSQMSGNPQHNRSLPPPPPISLPDPRSLPPPGSSGPHSAPQLIQGYQGSLPPAPGWQGSEDQMRVWLQTKGEEERRRQEEEKRKQEEEKSRQEQLRLEQRRVEQSMLQESLRAGVPPLLMPMLFIAIGGGANLAHLAGGPDYLQQYFTQVLSHQQQLAASASPERARAIQPPSQPPSFISQVVQATPQTPVGQSSYPQFPASTSGGPLKSGHSAATHISGRGQSMDMLPRLTTGQGGAAHESGAYAPTSQPQEAPSPIHFHHWTPPTSQPNVSSGGNSNATPGTPSDITNSPKKRKNTTSHPSVAPPSSRFSSDTSIRRPGHLRQRSDLSTRGTSSTDQNTRPNSSTTDSTPLTEPYQPPPQYIHQQHQQQQPEQWQHQPPPARPETVRPAHDQHPQEGRQSYGPKRLSQQHISSSRRSEDVEMS